MNLDDVCLKDQLPFLKHINQYYLVYCITSLAFIIVFSLAWILTKYTYFEKNKITKGPIPKFPYGNFRNIIKKESCLHVYLWKHYNRFKRKGCKYGGLFLFLRPIVLLTNLTISCKINRCVSYKNIFPRQSKLNISAIDRILNKKVLSAFVDKYNYSVKKALPEKLIKHDLCSTLKDSLLESTCLLYGFRPFEMVEEINQLLKKRHQTSFWYYYSLSVFSDNTRKVPADLKEVILEIMEERKKDGTEDNDLIQSYTEFYNNNSNYTIDQLADDVTSTFADTILYSYSTIMMCLYELIENSDVQEDLIGEIRSYNVKNKHLSYESLQELTYLDAVLKETFRKHPPVSTIIKSSTSLVKIDQFCQKKDILIFQSVLGVHRDPDYYTKPEAFDPDRFADKQYFTKNTFLPFGDGDASQIDMKLTSLQVTLALVSIFSYLEVKHKEGVTGTLNYSPSLMYLSPCEDLSLRVQRI